MTSPFEIDADSEAASAASELSVQKIPVNGLEAQVREYASSCDLIAAFGTTYGTGDGID